MRTDAYTSPAHVIDVAPRTPGESRAARRTSRGWIWAGLGAGLVGPLWLTIASIRLLRSRR